MFQGSFKDVTLHLNRMGRKVPKGENPIENLIDVIQEYDQCDVVGVEMLAEFARTGMKPPLLSDMEEIISITNSNSVAPSPSVHRGSRNDEKSQDFSYSSQISRRSLNDEFDHSLRSPYNNTPKSWSASNSAAFFKFTPSRLKNENRVQKPSR